MFRPTQCSIRHGRRGCQWLRAAVGEASQVEDVAQVLPGEAQTPGCAPRRDQKLIVSQRRAVRAGDRLAGAIDLGGLVAGEDLDVVLPVEFAGPQRRRGGVCLGQVALAQFGPIVRGLLLGCEDHETTLVASLPQCFRGGHARGAGGDDDEGPLVRARVRGDHGGCQGCRGLVGKDDDHVLPVDPRVVAREGAQRGRFEHLAVADVEHRLVPRTANASLVRRALTSGAPWCGHSAAYARCSPSRRASRIFVSLTSRAFIRPLWSSSFLATRCSVDIFLSFSWRLLRLGRLDATRRRSFGIVVLEPRGPLLGADFVWRAGGYEEGKGQRRHRAWVGPFCFLARLQASWSVGPIRRCSRWSAPAGSS